MADDSISIHIAASNTLAEVEPLTGVDVDEPCGTGCHPPGRTVRRKKKERAVTGVSVSTRNAANGNWKGDLKKLRRREFELKDAVLKIESLKKAMVDGQKRDGAPGKCSKLSAKDRALMEDDDELRWQLQQVCAELCELESLSKDDVLRMYSGC